MVRLHCPVLSSFCLLIHTHTHTLLASFGARELRKEIHGGKWRRTGGKHEEISTCLRARDGPFKANHSATSRTYSNEILTNVPRREVHLHRPQLNVPGKHRAYQDDGLVALVKDSGQHVAQIPRVSLSIRLRHTLIFSPSEKFWAVVIRLIVSKSFVVYIWYDMMRNLNQKFGISISRNWRAIFCQTSVRFER